VALLYWKQASGLIREFGGGLLLMACLALLFSLMSESRTIINFFPFFVMVSVGALDRQRDLSSKKVVLFALLSLLMSRVWLQIGDNHDLYYFMNFGPWMGRRVYYVFLVITIVATMLIYLLFKHKSNKRVLSVQELA
jgi:UDP-N-acetylmuramyl pentapeptide phosphotransferase/UDP-N-acetylglucosamine-1-phosphate transferase